MSKYLVDSHVHLGATEDGAPIKIGAGRTLTLRRVLDRLPERGVDVCAIVDLGTARGLQTLDGALASGLLHESDDGALKSAAGALIVPALEAEFRLPPAGPFHLLAYAPGLEGAQVLARIYRESVKNPNLSTQRVHGSPDDFRRAVEAAGGFVVIAHAFTPHRGLFGVGLMIADVFRDPQGLGLELGLSADVEIARTVGAVGDCGLLGGSDAHGPDTIGREMNAVQGEQPGFSLLRRLRGGSAETIYGMNPAFGKYHRTYCLVCGEMASGPPPQLKCEKDPAHRVVPGVLDRAASMAAPTAQRSYPEYRYQLPLRLLPGFGPSTRRVIVQRLGSEHRALHEADENELRATLGAARTDVILAMRRGALPSRPGGGGHWGRFSLDQQG
ncbi:MAG: hypothetical protein M0Z66_10155 [Thermaerobacter sp.]|nr:hypothetical protein [Thermaerobacter sp.]